MSFFEVILEEFELHPTEEQLELLKMLEDFIRSNETQQLMIIRGYAGTGKTTALAAFVRALSHYKVPVKLLAPTGRAAKVFSNKAGKSALTIHKQIYRRRSKVDISIGISLQPNLYKNALFIVDEASMIGDYTFTKDGQVSARNLLEDLIEFVYSADGCKMIFLGDDGQLPPVGSSFSPALSKEHLENHYPRLNVSFYQLTKVLRQSVDSQVLHNATLLRMNKWEQYPKLELNIEGDLKRITGLELQDELETSYDKYGMEDTIVITRSNKQANAYNQQIRGRILWYEELLCSGDCLMVVKNNYHWMGDNTEMGFIANGEIMKITRVLKTVELYGFEFAHVIVKFIDYDDVGEVELIIHTESITDEGASLSRARMKELFYEVEKDYAHLRSKKERYDAILADQYFNALQVKYAYAVTCHKSQGGQWSHVYIDQGYVAEESLTTDYYRWLYTALTRATEKVYLVNFSDDYFS